MPEPQPNHFSSPPEAQIWWFHSSPINLDDIKAPILLNVSPSWTPFSLNDVKVLEERYKCASTAIVGVEKLHYVDFAQGMLYPIYWTPITSSPPKVYRSSWFYADTMLPVDPALTETLEKGYNEIKPFTAAYDEELHAALEVGHLAEEKIRYPHTDGKYILYKDYQRAYIVTKSLAQRLSGSVLASLSKGKDPAPTVVRGYNPKHQPLVLPTIPPPTDLVLVIHGIGQKLSERMESFMFTHATNSLRLLVHSEAAAVQSSLRDAFSPQILPINWRSIIQYENMSIGATSDAEFTLQDITPEGIPAVRSMVADVLLDIPYYLSHHKQQIQETVIKETNRIYRLWCENNPGFVHTGRVHILGHSLGSAIAMDILSNQPTTLHQTFTGPISTDIFEFDTKTFFAVGSPCGFFMLLHQTNLIPRAGRRKTLNTDPGVAFDGVARYGCPAVDNIYNVYHSCDPVAQKLAPTVDSKHALSLAPSVIPPLSASLLSTFSFRSLFEPSLPPNRSSTIELSLHDFSKESIAEQRFKMLNDYSQIDFVLQSQGVVESQYLTMIGAHGSYWTSREFARFLAVEIGRPEGPEYCVESLKGVKKPQR